MVVPVLRAARPGEEDAVAALSAAAFSADPPRRPAPRDPDPDQVLRRVAEDPEDGRLLASATARVCGQWWGGRRVPAIALSGVSVDLTARGRGIGRALLADTFDAARAAGAHLVALVPSTHAFYRGAGCGIAGRRPVYAIATHELSALPRPAVAPTYREATAQDAPAVAALVAARAARTNGALDHDGSTGSAVQYVARREGRVVGWCALGRRPSARGNYAVTVLDLVAADAATELALWRDLVADAPSAREVHALVPAGSLLEHHLPRQTEPVEDATWMLGLLDVAGALTARGYPAGVSARFALETGPRVLTLEVADGRARVTAGAAPGAAPVSLDPADLASVYAGHLDPVTARHAGLLDADPVAAASLRTLFAGPPAVLDRPF
ncbi:putative acetyltransferase [Kineococcus radiotolerans]|uniref:Putative acetyltransferase n=1 Tax=Kineococcus radiotolerans TaxID=131568 RepID=A0A7W4TLN4_KINRA|nr:GNAT family N-acetyltransferase [Kineococcus radiotolerans]MBB2901105.1 putative acetyltransferase [Kineococcus radiotolerans]